MSIEVLGTCASIMVILSLISSNIKWLRILNLIGSVMFVIYACIIGSFSVGLTNTFGIVFNLYHLIKLSKGSKSSKNFSES